MEVAIWGRNIAGPDGRNPAVNADGAPATWEHPGGQLGAPWKPCPDDSEAGERCNAQDRAKPARLQQAIWHWGSSDCTSSEITGTGPNSRISASAMAWRTPPAACRTAFI